MDNSNVLLIFKELLAQVPPAGPPLPPAAAGGSGGDMEPRIAALEADMKHVKDSLAKLGDVPADLATLKTQALHTATKLDVSAMGNDLATRVQRQMYIIGALLAILATILRFLPVK